MLRPVTGQGIPPKRLAAYLRRMQKTTDIYAQKQGEQLLVSSGFLFAKIALSEELATWIPKGSETVKYPLGASEPEVSTRNYTALWNTFVQEPALAVLTTTNILYEAYPSLYRQLVDLQDQTKPAIWVSKQLTDLLVPDPEELAGYLLEMIQRDTVRVGAYWGWCAFLISNRSIKASRML